MIAGMVLVLNLTLTAAESPKNEEMKMKNQWVQEHLTDAKAKLPFSFVYDGKASEALLSEWAKKVDTKKLDANRTEHTLKWTDPKSGLEVRCVAVDYADYPAVEWLLHFANTGNTNSPIIEKIQALDCNLPGAGKGFVLHRALGEANSERSFAPVDEPLPPGDVRDRVYAPNGGRSSDGNMPYFNVDRQGGGMVLAIGWSGQWEAGFQSLADGSLRVRAGQQLTHFTLHAGETVRSPRIVLAFWQGSDDLRGNNIFRQLVLKHYLPQKDGQPVFPPICASTGVVAPDGTYEKPHLDAIAPMKDRGVEVFWSDMDPQQWYPGGFPNGTGTWEVDKSKYPNGLKPLGDAIRAAGLGYLLWFEPERVASGTKIAREHPEWVHGGSGGGLFRFDDATALKWMIELIDAHVTTAQLTWVRWDFNIEPLGYWRRNDAPDRQGITEIRHMEGLYGVIRG
jgi:alpha-galactosidase